jgi:hypothetical protein
MSRRRDIGRAEQGPPTEAALLRFRGSAMDRCLSRQLLCGRPSRVPKAAQHGFAVRLPPTGGWYESVMMGTKSLRNLTAVIAWLALITAIAAPSPCADCDMGRCARQAAESATCCCEIATGLADGGRQQISAGAGCACAPELRAADTALWTPSPSVSRTPFTAMLSVSVGGSTIDWTQLPLTSGSGARAPTRASTRARSPPAV